MNTYPGDPTDRSHIEERLDEALDESFPASDSPAVSLGDEPPAQSRFGPEEEDFPDASARKGLFTKILAGGALAAAGVVVTRMLLRRSARGRRH